LQEAQLLAAKMECASRLAAGLSERLEDLLAAIPPFRQDVLDRMEGDDGLRAASEAILGACHRAETTLRQLVAVGRRQALAPAIVDCNRKIQQTLELLQGVLGENVAVEAELASDPGFVRVDPVQLELALIHLLVNARDAMPEGGRLTLRTERLEPGDCPRPPVGPHVRISVTDTGCGMDGDALARAFEPFFSTKKRGSGLGLATVYGFASQSGGHVSADSRRGEGSTFTLCLPAVRDMEESNSRAASEALGGAGPMQAVRRRSRSCSEEGTKGRVAA